MLQNVFGFFASSFYTFFIDFAVRTGERRLDQDVSDLHLLRLTVFVTVLVVVCLQVLIGDGRGRWLGRLDNRVLDLPLLGDGIVIRCFVAIVEGFQFLVGGMKSLQNVGLREHRIVKLDLSIPAVEFRADFWVTYKCAARNQGSQLANQDVFLLQIFELRDGQVGALSEVLVLFLTHEFAFGEQHGGERPVL